LTELERGEVERLKKTYRDFEPKVKANIIFVYSMGAFLTAHSAYHRKWLRFILLPPTTFLVSGFGILYLGLYH